MSKPSSGHFSGTTGAKNAYNNAMSNRSVSDIIAERTSSLDLREHPIKSRSKTPLKAINRKIHDVQNMMDVPFKDIIAIALQNILPLQEKVL